MAPTDTGSFVLSATAVARDVVLFVPGATRALERYHIDYCCEGHRTLEALAHDARAPIADVLRALEEERAKGGEADAGLLSITLASLVEHVVSEHHGRTHVDAVRVAVLLRAASRELDASAVAPLSEAAERHFTSLLAHLAAEESVLFPYALELDRAGATGRPAPVAIFASARHVIADLERDHHREETGAAELRELAARLADAAPAMEAARELLTALEDHARDLQRHMHVEGNALFPRIERLEAKLRPAARRR